MAVVGGRTDIALLLIQAGANIKAVNTWGITALMAAAYEGHTDIALALIRAGANINAVNKNGKTALDTALEKSEAEMVTILNQANAFNNVKRVLLLSKVERVNNDELHHWPTRQKSKMTNI